MVVEAKEMVLQVWSGHTLYENLAIWKKKKNADSHT